MAGDAKKKSTRDVVDDLTDDVLVDILSRLPIKSLCRCKLVSTRWRNVISHPEHRKKLPQTLADFFHESYDSNRFPKWARHFTNVSRAAGPFIDPSLSVDPSLSFLPEYESIDIKDSCNGLLLCHCWKLTDPVIMESVVCNPATEKWVVVPDSGWSSEVRITRLGFDPTVSSHFHVFEFITDDIWYGEDGGIDADGRIEVVAVYSSKIGVWSLKVIDDDDDDDDDLPIAHCHFAMHTDSKGVFFNGVLHLTTYYGMVLAIDVEGKVSRCIPIPEPYNEDDPPHVYLSQGHLYLARVVSDDVSDDYQLSVWVLEDYNSEKWTLKYNLDSLDLFGVGGGFFSVISIHPEHDMIYMVCGIELMSYEMNHMWLRFISQLGWGCEDSYIPYVPVFLESLADDEQ